MSTKIHSLGSRATIFCGGTAHVPRPSGKANSTLMVEIELDLQSKSVVAAYVSPELQGLKELLQSTVLGQSIEDIPTPGFPAAGERYFSAYHNVMRSALCMSSAFLGLFGPFFNEYPDISLSS